MTKKLVVADDESFSRKIVCGMIRDVWPHTIVPVASGSDALAELVGPGGGDVCALISDFNMPGCNGLNVLKAVRMGMDGIRRDLPVLMLTGHADKGLIGTAMALDVDAFLAKPVSKATLHDKFKRVLESERPIRPAETYAHIKVREDMLIQWSEQAKDKKVVVGTNDLDLKTGASAMRLEAIPEGATLAAPIQLADGMVIVPAGRVLNRALVDRLRDLRAMGHGIEPIWVAA